MLTIGLTGGIGTGKSEVSRILKELGATVIDADRVGHEAYKVHSSAWQEVVDVFGEKVLSPTGEIDRKQLGGIVFSDPVALSKLNSIMHPQMAEIIKEKIRQLQSQGIETVVVEAALLVEAGWDSMVDEVWVTYSTEEMVIERLRQRNNLSEEEIQGRVRSQMPYDKRARYAQVVVDNSGNMDQLKESVLSLWSTRIKGKVRLGEDD